MAYERTIITPPVKLFAERVARASEEMIKAAASALRIEHELIMTAAKKDTPVEFNTLRSSGTVFPTEITPTYLRSRGGFGGAAKEYAIPVHEIMTNKHPRGGHAKFYENALLAGHKGLDARLAARIRARVKF